MASAPLPVTVSVVGNLYNGLVHYWTFNDNGGTNLSDTVGTATGTLSGFAAPFGWVTGQNGSALSFDGVASYVSLPSLLLNLTNNFTIAASIRPGNAASAGVFLAIRSCYPTSGLRCMVFANKLQIQGETTAGYQDSSFDLGGIQNGNWYNVVLTYDQSVLHVYVNGADMGAVNWIGDMVMNPSFGSRFGDEGSYYFNGQIDNVMIFNRVLGPAEVPTLAQGVFQSLVPTITSVVKGSASSVVRFATVPSTVTNENYEVDYCTDLSSGTWSVLTNGIPGTGGIITITDIKAAGQAKRYYRVVGHF